LLEGSIVLESESHRSLIVFEWQLVLLLMFQDSKPRYRALERSESYDMTKL
jgi:hypothetical protein